MHSRQGTKVYHRKPLQVGYHIHGTKGRAKLTGSHILGHHIRGIKDRASHFWTTGRAYQIGYHRQCTIIER
ncbi:hypothetical protein Bpfe_017235, partial [Biomphalaria pfeifferi]